MLNHINDPAETPVATSRLLRPVGADDVRVRVDPSDHDPKVMKCAAHVAKMESVDAAPSVITRARQKLAEARTDFLEKAAEGIHKQRKITLDAQRAKRHDEIEREIKHRLTKPSEVALKIANAVLVTISTDRAMNSTARQHAVGDVQRTIQIQIRESERAARLAATGQSVAIDAEKLARELQDICRRSIRNADCVIELL